MNETLRGLVCVAVLLGATAVAGVALAAEGRTESLSAARAAAAAGDAARAIALYNQVLTGDPDDPAALAESAQQLSWLGRYDEALSRYRRVLELEPENRFAHLEQAKVLSWARRYDESIAAFDRLLADDPQQLEARLGRARALSWAGRQPAARTAYQAVLADHPGQADALLGLAQTYAWSGALGEARRRYEAANLALAGRPDAEVGLAYLDLWEGSPVAARQAAERLAARHPGNGDVRELLVAARSATAPWLAAGWSQMDDSDGNLLTQHRVEAGFWGPGEIRTRLAWSDYDLRSAGEDGGIRSLQAFAEWMPAPRHRLDLMLGLDRLDRPEQPSHDVTTAGLAYRFPVSPAWSGWIGAQREPYRYSVPLIDNRIVIESVAAGTSGRAGQAWWLSIEASGWRLSDDNERLAADVSARRQWQAGGHSLELGLGARWLDWNEDLDHGYFDPTDFRSVGLLARAHGPLGGGGRATYDIGVESGVQSFDSGGRHTSSDAYYLAVGRIGWQVTDRVRLEAFGEAGSYASEGAEDWDYTRVGARLVWRLGTGRER